MADKYASVAGAGAKTGADWANAYDNTQIVGTALPALSGGTLYVEADTYNITGVWSMGANNDAIVAVNASSHVEDGSKAILNAASTYASSIDGTARTNPHVRNIDSTASTSVGIYLSSTGSTYNCIGRNGVYGIAAGYVVNSTGYGSTYGIYPLDLNAVNCKAYTNSSRGYTDCGCIINSLAYDNATGIRKARLVEGCVLDDNTTGFDAVSIPAIVMSSSITNNTTGLKAAATNYINEIKNLYYSNTAKFGGTTANIFSIDGSVDGSATPYNNQAGRDYKPSSGAEMLGTEFPYGDLSDTTNISYANAGLEPEPLAVITVSDINPVSGLVGATITITGTGFTASGNIVKLGGSGGTSCTVTSETTTEIQFTIPSISAGVKDVYIENSDGANNLFPNGCEVIVSSAPTFGGITKWEACTNGVFALSWSAATGTVTNYNVYISESAITYSEVPLIFDDTVTEVYLKTLGDGTTFFKNGTTYYFAVRAENSGSEETNTVTASNVCVGAETIQKVQNTIAVVSK
ncbi:MAG: hypothetical protein GY861_11290 [bacterium]|nr:hypothetical protein [bacterium]